MSTGLLEVAVDQARDVAGALDGGADRLALAVGPRARPRSPDLATASAVLRESDVPVRVTLRLNDSLTTTGGEFTRLVGLAEEYLALGAEGVAFGFLDADLEVDVQTPAPPWPTPCPGCRGRSTRPSTPRLDPAGPGAACAGCAG